MTLQDRILNRLQEAKRAYKGPPRGGPGSRRVRRTKVEAGEGEGIIQSAQAAGRKATETLSGAVYRNSETGKYHLVSSGRELDATDDSDAAKIVRHISR